MISLDENKLDKITTQMVKNFEEYTMRYLLFQELRRQGDIKEGFQTFRKMYISEKQRRYNENPVKQYLPAFREKWPTILLLVYVKAL